MELLSRRNVLRTAGTTGLATASLLGGSSLLSPVSGSTSPKKVRAKLNRSTYRVGQKMVLRVHHQNLKPGCRIRITDSGGLRWKRVAGSVHPQVWTAKADRSGPGRITVKVLWPNGRAVHNDRYRDHAAYQVLGGGGSIDLAGGPLIGMNAPADQWDQRVNEVGPGLAARRIFADLAAGPTNQIRLVEAAHAAGLLPVISYKVGGDIAGAISGKYNAVAEQAATKLASYGLPTAVTFWHEPNPDLTGAEYAAASRQLVPIFKRGELRVGPILNGWLLDRQQPLFASFCPDDLMETWDWFGIDTYETGTVDRPSAFKPADAIRAMSSFVTSRGHDLPLGIGEYNGLTAATITAAGEAMMTTPNVWFGCVWNQNLDFASVLTGERLAAFRRTLEDPRSAEPRVAARSDDRRHA